MCRIKQRVSILARKTNQTTTGTSWWLEKAKHYTHFQEGGYRELQTDQSHLTPGEGCGANPSGSNLWAHVGQEDKWQQPAWIYDTRHCIWPTWLPSVTGWQALAVDIMLLGFSKAFDIFCCHILILSLKYGLSRKMGWIEGLQELWISCTKSNWKPRTSGDP